MKLSFTTLDVFTSTRYNGNPLAVISVSAPSEALLTQTKKQKIAAEFNLSEIIFLHLASPSPASDESLTNEFTIDIFMPNAEIPFAGHPTVGAAYFLLHVLKLPAVALRVKAGRIPISLDPGTGDVKADVPQDFHVHRVRAASELVEAEAPCVSIVKGMSFILVSLPDLPALAKARGNIAPEDGSKCLDEGWQEGFIGTMYFVAQGEDEFGRGVYRTRMYADGFEDPGTGSASCALGCWLASQGGGEKGLHKFSFVQGLEMGRQNDISVEVLTTGDKGATREINRVFLSGTCVEVMEGTLEV